ncbi:MAG: type II secretion system protein [Polyangiaceae bacterium]
MSRFAAHRRARLRAAVLRGFTLLEVMVSVAILGLALTVILSAQGGLAASNQSAANMGGAIHYGRCKMQELEERLLRTGYPEIDDLQTGLPCCADDSGNFRCDTRIEKIELPQPPQNTLGDGGLLSLSSGDGGGALGALAGGAGSAGAGGGLLNPAGGAGLNLDAGIGGLSSQLSQTVPGGAAGLFSMAMSFVYPTMKMMMEASIRRLTVTVRWKDGRKDRELALVQYVTNPQRGGFISGVIDPNAAAGGAPAAGGASPAGASTSRAATTTGTK